jgi:hypothetical protein
LLASAGKDAGRKVSLWDIDDRGRRQAAIGERSSGARIHRREH